MLFCKWFHQSNDPRLLMLHFLFRFGIFQKSGEHRWWEGDVGGAGGAVVIRDRRNTPPEPTHACLLAPLWSVHVSNSDQPLVPSLLCLPVHYTVSNGHCPCVTQVMLCPTHVTLTRSTLQHPVSKIILHFAPSHKPPQHNHFCPCGFQPSSSFRRKVYLCPSVFVQLANIIVDANIILLLICRILQYPTDQNNKQRKATVSF